MTGPHLDDDRLIDLAAGLVAHGDEPRLLRHLESCPECEGRFRETCREAEMLRLRRHPQSPPRTLRWAALAAAVLLTASLLFLWERAPAPGSATDPDPASYWFPLGEETVELRAGPGEGDEAAFEKATEAYRRRDAAEVVTLLTGRPIPRAHDPLRIVLASALVKTGDPVGARKTLEELDVETLPQPDRDRARWILHAALAAEGKDEEARAVAQGLASGDGEFSQAARRLLRQGSPARTNPPQ